MEQKSLLLTFSSAATRMTAYSEVSSQMAAELKIKEKIQLGMKKSKQNFVSSIS
jgi:hypothetical protein